MRVRGGFEAHAMLIRGRARVTMLVLHPVRRATFLITSARSMVDCARLGLI